MKYCIKRDVITDIINVLLLDQEPTNHITNSYIELAKEFTAEIIIVSYLLGISLLKIKKTIGNDEVLEVLENIFLIDEEYFLSYETLDHDFVDYLMQNVTDNNLGLEDELVSLVDEYKEQSYR